MRFENCDECKYADWNNERQTYYCLLNHWYAYRPENCDNKW